MKKLSRSLLLVNLLLYLSNTSMALLGIHDTSMKWMLLLFSVRKLQSATCVHILISHRGFGILGSQKNSNVQRDFTILYMLHILPQAFSSISTTITLKTLITILQLENSPVFQLFCCPYKPILRTTIKTKIIHFDIWQNQYNIIKLKNKIKKKTKQQSYLG